MLGERASWWENNRCAIDRCSIVACGIAPLADKPNYYSQQDSLVELKKLYPEYKAVHSQVLQNCVKRVDLAYERFVAGDINSRRSGRPRFKGRGRYHSLTFAQVKRDCIQNNRINLPKIDWVKLVCHRPIPDGFKIKSATIVQKVTGWYISLSLEDKAIPENKIDIQPSVDNCLGIDMGLKEFLVTSEKETISIPKYYRKSERKLKRLQRQLFRKEKGSKRRDKAVKRVAKIHLKVANKRKDFHHKTVNWLLRKSKCIAYEDLNTRGLARTNKAKSIHDAGWSAFLSLLSVKAVNAGQLAIAVSPYNTTQNCSGCGQKVPKELADRWHFCPHCSTSLDRDHNAALNIKQKAIGHFASAHGGIGQKTPDEVRSPLCNV
jgi:putative transposase